MSHELRTPLNAIIGYSDLMASGVHGPLPPKYQEYLDRICRSQRHLVDLIEGVAATSPVESAPSKDLSLP